MLSQDRLKELFDYDQITGVLYNRVNRGPRALAGKRAGSFSPRGYRDVKIDGVSYREHRVIWLYLYGKWPEDKIDHRNGNRGNNAKSELRAASGEQNNFNSNRAVGASGLRGVYFDPRSTKWYSQIKIGGRFKWLGSFGSPEEAHQAFMAAVELHHGEFAFHNRSSERSAN